jgi:hypothetical protein
MNMLTHLKTLHFWLTAVAVAIGGSLEAGWIPSIGTAHTLAILAMMALSSLGVGYAARWVPPSPDSPKPPAIPPTAALLLLFALPSLTGCAYCLDQAHRNEPRCQIQDTASKCGTPAIEKVVEQILPQVVLALVNDSWSTLLDQIVATLQQQGVQDALTAVTCAVSSVDINISSVLGGARAAALNPALIQSVHEHAVAWRAAHSAMARR